MFIIGHMEISNSMCRTDLIFQGDQITMEYPCEYYSELKEIDKTLKEM